MLKANQTRISVNEIFWFLLITRFKVSGENEMKTKKKEVKALYFVTTFNPLPSQELF